MAQIAQLQGFQKTLNMQPVFHNNSPARQSTVRSDKSQPPVAQGRRLETVVNPPAGESSRDNANWPDFMNPRVGRGERENFDLRTQRGESTRSEETQPQQQENNPNESRDYGPLSFIVNGVNLPDSRINLKPDYNKGPAVRLSMSF